jgi:hypothetical protein
LGAKAAGERNATGHGAQRNARKNATPTLPQGKSVWPKAMGEGRAVSGEGSPLTRTAVAVSTSPDGRGEGPLR